jgi:hypothetical protein
MHMFLPPSGAAAWEKCAYWPTMNAMFPQPPDEDTLEGEASHWAFAEILPGRPVAVGQVAPNGVVLSEEMIDGAEMFVDVVDGKLAECGLTRDYLVIEQFLPCGSIHPQNGGTPDAFFYAAEMGRIAIFDYKFGHRFVDAFENWQLLNYAAAILEALGVNGLQDQFLIMELIVVQPRNYDRSGPVRSWTVRASELRGYFNKLRNAAEAALMPEPKSTPNDECRDCPGKHACTALQRSAYWAADQAYQVTPVELPEASLGLELQMLKHALKRLEARVKGLEETAEMRIMMGQIIPGFAVERNPGRRVWNVPANEVAALGALFQKDLTKQAVVTPTQAKNLGVDEAVINAYSVVPLGNPKLVPVNSTDARKVFSK